MIQQTTIPWPATLSNVPQIFSWKDNKPLHNKLYEAYHGYLSQKYHQRLERFFLAGVGNELLDLTGDLSEEGRNRIILAPPTCYDLLYAPPSDLVYHLESARAELCLAGNCKSKDITWTALGDHCFVPPIPANGWSIYDIVDRPQPSPEKTYHAPTVRGGIPIDFHSFHAIHRIKEDTQEFIPMTAGERKLAVEKVDQALGIIESSCPAAYEMVLRYTRVILLGNNPKTPEIFSSSSTELYTGRVVIVNAHTKHTSIDDLVDSLVHEAIHNLLYVVEVKHPLIPKDKQETSDHQRINSPWTGNSLYLHPFLHACFVWLGMWCFWEYLSTNGKHSFSESVVQYRIDRSKSGFLKTDMFTALKTAEPHLSDEAKEVMFGFAMQARRHVLPIH